MGENIEDEVAITKEMTLGEIVMKYPKTAGVFLEHGLYCFGCGVARFETLEQGAYAHGMDDQGIKSLLKDLNGVVKEQYRKKD